MILAIDIRKGPSSIWRTHWTYSIDTWTG